MFIASTCNLLNPIEWQFVLMRKLNCAFFVYIHQGDPQMRRWPLHRDMADMFSVCRNANNIAIIPEGWHIPMKYILPLLV